MDSSPNFYLEKMTADLSKNKEFFGWIQERRLQESYISKKELEENYRFNKSIFRKNFKSTRKSSLNRVKGFAACPSENDSGVWFQIFQMKKENHEQPGPIKLYLNEFMRDRKLETPAYGHQEAQPGFINEYNIRFQKMLYKYGIINENDEWEKVIEYTNEVKIKQENANEYYDLSLIYLKEKRLGEALDSLNEGIKKLPYPDKNYFFLKHHILIKLGRYLEGTENLFNYLWEIAGNDIEEIEKFKKTYESFIQTIINNGNESYKIIEEINVKTKSKLGRFAQLNITPHLFKYEELDTTPF